MVVNYKKIGQFSLLYSLNDPLVHTRICNTIILSLPKHIYISFLLQLDLLLLLIFFVSYATFLDESLYGLITEEVFAKVDYHLPYLLNYSETKHQCVQSQIFRNYS